MNTKILLLTAGLSPGDLTMAARRISKNAEELFEFDDILVLSSETLSVICPEVTRLYSLHLSDEIRGFGFWSWKSEFVFRALRGDFGKYEQVVWLDAGCEVNSNQLSRKVFRGRINSASEKGHWLHALDNSDLEYSKKHVTNQFPKLSENELGKPQIQANYFHLQGRAGRQIAEAWFAKTIEGIENLNLESIGEHERKEFIQHRSDQSLLSLVCKNQNYRPSKLNLPSGRSRKSIIRGIAEPVWISRNRSGDSIVPSVLRKF